MEDRMKKLLSILVLTLLSVYLIAEGVEQTEQPQFTEEQMDAKAAQFKAETGFKGDIFYNLRNGVFGGIEGTMPSIAVQDTLSARICAETLLNLLQPYLQTSREQLVLKMNYQNEFGCRVVYYQQFDSLLLDPRSSITFKFRTDGSSYFEVYGSLVPNLNVQTDNLISRSAAEEIINKELSGKIVRRYDPHLNITRKWSEATAENKQPENYKPCWIVSYDYNSDVYIMYIDAISGTVLRIKEDIPFY
jgi:hypothetical protein